MKKIVKIFSALGTLNTITIYFENEDNKKANIIINKIEKYIDELDDKLSIFKDTSEISLINRHAGINFKKVSKDTYELLKLAKEYGKITNGAFDITTKPLTDLWRKNKQKNITPKFNEVSQILKNINYKDIILNKKEQSIMLKNKGQEIDVGGIAKGYIIDKVKTKLKNNNFNNAIINLGGTVSSIGENRNIGIRNPFVSINNNGQNDFFAIIKSKDENIVTSGSYEQFYERDGRIYHHIINPNTGYPTKTGLVSVTLIGNNGTELDALATGCFILGLEKSFKLIRKRKLNAIFVLNDGKIYMTDELKNRVKIIKM